MRRHQTFSHSPTMQQIPRSMRACDVIGDLSSQQPSGFGYDELPLPYSQQSIMEECQDYSSLSYQLSSSSNGHDISTYQRPLASDYASSHDGFYSSTTPSPASTGFYDSDWSLPFEPETDKQFQSYQLQSYSDIDIQLERLYSADRFSATPYSSSSSSEPEDRYQSLNSDMVLSSNVAVYCPATSDTKHDSPSVHDMSLGGESHHENSDTYSETDNFSDTLGVSSTSNRITDEPYAKLIYRALMQSENHSMALQDIYDWFELHTDKVRSNKDGKEVGGWKNSIRHNLSMNEAFVKRPGLKSTSTEESKKSSIWTLDHAKVLHGVNPTTRFRKEKSKTTKTPLRKGAGGSSHIARNRKVKRRHTHRKMEEIPSSFLTPRSCYTQPIYHSPSSCLSAKTEQMSPATSNGFGMSFPTLHDGFYDNKPILQGLPELFIAEMPCNELASNIDINTPLWNNKRFCAGDDGLMVEQYWSGAYEC